MLKVQLCITYILKSIQIEIGYSLCNNSSQYYCFYCIFAQINAVLVSIRDFQTPQTSALPLHLKDGDLHKICIYIIYIFVINIYFFT